MKLAVLIGGLPASGKSTYGAALAADLEAALVDDPRDFSEVAAVLNGDRDVVVVDPYLCADSARRTAIGIFRSNGFRVVTVVYENNLAGCLAAAAARLATEPEKTVAGLIRLLHGRHSTHGADHVVDIFAPGPSARELKE